jgi:cyanophycinase
MSGTLALVGGGEWRDGCDFDAELLTASGGTDVLVLPTAGAYEHPERLVAVAADWFGALGATATGLDVLRRPDAEDAANVAAVRAARFIYLAGRSPMHLRAVLKDTPLWVALVEAWRDGAVVAGSDAGAMALCDPMVDPRGGALTLGLGMIEQVGVIPRHDTWSDDKERRTLQIAPAGLPIVGIDERSALIRAPDGSWRAAGAGTVTVYVDGAEAGLSALPG